MKTQTLNKNTLNRNKPSKKLNIINSILPKRLLSVILILGLSVIIFTSAGYSQSGWFSQPLPVNGQVLDLKFFDANTGLIAMRQPTALLRTTNGGYNWNIVLTIQVAWQFELIDSNIVYAIGSGVTTSSDGILLKSTNRGANWDSLPVANSWTVNGISFVNKDTGWVGGTSGGLPFVWRTTNAGVSWVVQSDDTGFGPVIFLKKKVNGEYIGWCVAYEEMWKTTNSGMNWTQIQTGFGIGEMYFMDENTGYVSSADKFKKTTDGGMNWSVYLLPYGFNINGRIIVDFKFINKDTVYGDNGYRNFGAVDRGIIWISTNGGVNWNFQQPDTSIRRWRFYGLHFENKDTGFSTWIRTNDGGGPIIITGINTQITEAPEIFSLEQNYPNPFNSSTRVNFSVSTPSYITLRIYDITGKEIMNIYRGEFFTTGNYFAAIDIGKSGFSSGVYIYSMTASDLKGNISFSGFKKMVYLK